jgi:hypothetical protein
MCKKNKKWNIWVQYLFHHTQWTSESHSQGIISSLQFQVGEGACGCMCIHVCVTGR